MEHLTHEEIRKQFHYEPSQHIDDFHLAGFAYYGWTRRYRRINTRSKGDDGKGNQQSLRRKGSCYLPIKTKSLVIFLPAITHLFPHSFIMVTAISLKQEFKW